MHHHADGAMIGIGGRWMNVNHLDERQQSQQQQTNDSSRAHGPRLALNYSIRSMLSANFH